MEGDVVNINAVSNNPASLQYMTAVRSSEPDRVSENHISEKAVEPAEKVIEEPPFYEYRKEPWLTEPGYTDAQSREEYVALKKIDQYINLSLMQFAYDGFMKTLVDTHPDIASKKFGFTLSEDATLKIIDYENRLTEDDKTVLVESMRRFDNFELRLQVCAKGMMALVDHDHKTFGGRYMLDISNFQDVIDFRKILSVGAKAMNNEWAGQVSANAEARDPSYISLSV
jgi:hypothetical protein